MRVEDVDARDFYEREAIEWGWSKAQLERQIHSFYYDRIIANRGKEGLIPAGRERLPGELVQPSHLLKSPMVLEFLGLPDSPELPESKLEQAIEAVVTASRYLKKWCNTSGFRICRPPQTLSSHRIRSLVGNSHHDLIRQISSDGQS